MSYRERHVSLPSKAPVRICRCGRPPAMHKGWSGAGVGEGPACHTYRQVGRLKYFKNNMGLQTEGHGSNFERDYGFELKHQQSIGEIIDLVEQYVIPLYVNRKKVTTFIADFFVAYKDGRKAIIETKGVKQEAFRLKWNLLNAIYSVEHPDIELRIEMQARRGRW